MDKEKSLNTEKAYYVLFRQVSSAIEEMNKLNFGTARDILIAAQKTAEEIAISEE